VNKKRLVSSAVLALAPILLVLGGGLFDAAHATGQQSSCDFVTGGGQIPGPSQRNFGVAGGVKNGAFWGHLEYHDKAIDLKVEDRTITGYYMTDAATRVIEGLARTNKYGDRNFRVTVSDYGKRDNEDYFKIEILGAGYVAQGYVRKGEIKLHKKNGSCTPPPGYTCQEPEPDTQPPTVSITAPACGSTVKGTVTVTADAADDVGVTMVEFFVNGVLIGTDTTSPYEATWNTTTAAEDQSATLTAKAHDAAGNITTSSACNVTVDNQAPPDTTAPTNVAIVSPTCGSATPVSGTVDVEATASDNVGVASVQLFVDGVLIGTDTAADTNGRYSVSWNTTTVTDGPHTLTAVARDAAGNSTSSPSCSVNVLNAPAPLITTVFVSLVNGDVHEYTSEGVLLRIYPGASNGQASSLAFDAAGNMYVPHWIDPTSPLLPGNTIERFNLLGVPMGTFGTGYNCNPSSVDFDTAGNVYVGQADCTGDVLKFSPTGVLLATYDVLVQARGSDHIELAPDNCTLYYSSRGVPPNADILRYNVCTGTQMTKFNTASLPDSPFHIELLPDGGLLVANGTAGITRLDASGNFVRTYFTPVPPGSGGNLWGGVDLAPDGTSFWASNGFNGDIVRFDLATGAVLNFFNTGTGNFTAAGVEVRP
jgi:YD repeat-containing protein